VPASVTVTVYVVGGAEAGNGERPGPMALAKVAARRFAANIARGTICGQSQRNGLISPVMRQFT
jgi:hypothetical protein